VFFDALRVRIRDEGTVKNKAVYLALGVPSHAICVSFLTLITTEVLGRNLGFDWVQVFVS